MKTVFEREKCQPNLRIQMELLDKMWGRGWEVKFSKKDLHSPQIREWYGEKNGGEGVLHCHAFFLLKNSVCIAADGRVRYVCRTASWEFLNP
jgi:hypothetical protein